MERVGVSAFLFRGCQRDVTKHVSVHEHELAALTAITVSVTLIQTAANHKETPTPEEESWLPAGLITPHTRTHMDTHKVHEFTDV